jgi:signal transduction histidine kinase
MNGKPFIVVAAADPHLRDLLRDLLNQAGYESIEDAGQSDLLGSDSSHQPDLVLLEAIIYRVNDYAILDQLKASPVTSEIPVIILSDNGDAQFIAGALEKGAADVIGKTFEKAELLARIKTQLNLKRKQDTLKAYTLHLEELVKEMTRQLMHAERLASLGTLAAGLAHEINNPATFITGNLQTLEQFWNKISAHVGAQLTEGASPQIEYMMKEFPAMIESIRLGAYRITDLVAGLKAFSRKNTTLKEFTDIKKCVREALNLTHNQLRHYIKVETFMSADLPLIWANAQQLVQVFVNLIMNASDAIGKQEGKITISVQPNDDGLLEIRIMDTGHGMTPEVVARIFEPFYTTKPIPLGTGLGLSITQGIIKDHLGIIDVFSQPGHGTTFIITLPTQQPQSAPTLFQ